MPVTIEIDEVDYERLREENKNLRAAVDVLAPKAPPGYGEVLSPVFETLLLDKGCREPIGWGFRILKKVEDEALNDALKKHGDIEFLHGAVDATDAQFGLIVRWLTEEEAAIKYGKRGPVEFGPRGGFKQVLYGDKAFNHRKMRPRSE